MVNSLLNSKAKASRGRSADSSKRSRKEPPTGPPVKPPAPMAQRNPVTYTFVIDPMSMVGADSLVFHHYMECLQIMCFSIAGTDFDGLPETIEYLETRATLYDFILASTCRSRVDFDMTKFTKKGLCYPKTPDSWIRLLASQARSIAVGLLGYNLQEHQKDVEKGDLPESLSINDSDGPKSPSYNWADGPPDGDMDVEVKMDSSVFSKSDTSALAKSYASKVSTNLPKPQPPPLPDKQKESDSSGLSRTKIRNNARIRAIRCMAHLGTDAAAEVRARVARDGTNRAKTFSLSSGEAVKMVSSFVSGAYPEVVNALLPVIGSLPCQVVADALDPSMHLLERAHEWKSIPLKCVYTTDQALAEQWASASKSSSS